MNAIPAFINQGAIYIQVVKLSSKKLKKKNLDKFSGKGTLSPICRCIPNLSFQISNDKFMDQLFVGGSPDSQGSFQNRKGGDRLLLGGTGDPLYFHHLTLRLLNLRKEKGK